MHGNCAAAAAAAAAANADADADAVLSAIVLYCCSCCLGAAATGTLLNCASTSSAAMDRAIDQFLHSNSTNNEAQLELWPEEAVQLLLFTCNKDPSVRIRRAAMSLLTSVVSKQQSAQEQAIVHTLILKCRDKDAKVQCQAYEMLVQLPIIMLRAHLQIEDWRAVLDTAILTTHAVKSDTTDADHQQANDDYTIGTQLLHRYLDTYRVLQSLSNDTIHAGEAGCPQDLAGVDLALNAVYHASQYLQALQLPWHSSTVQHAYSSALADCLSLTQVDSAALP